jgi:hypothetical protein
MGRSAVIRTEPDRAINIQNYHFGENLKFFIFIASLWVHHADSNGKVYIQKDGATGWQ